MPIQVRKPRDRQKLRNSREVIIYYVHSCCELGSVLGSEKFLIPFLLATTVQSFSHPIEKQVKNGKIIVAKCLLVFHGCCSVRT